VNHQLEGDTNYLVRDKIAERNQAGKYFFRRIDILKKEYLSQIRLEIRLTEPMF